MTAFSNSSTVVDIPLHLLPIVVFTVIRRSSLKTKKLLSDPIFSKGLPNSKNGTSFIEKSGDIIFRILINKPEFFPQSSPKKFHQRVRYEETVTRNRESMMWHDGITCRISKAYVSTF